MNNAWKHRQQGRAVHWIAWIAMSLGLAGYLGLGLMNSGAREGISASARSVLLPGATTSGHYQIELACDACHTTPFADGEAMQEACVGCHAKELKVAEDKHPLTKFLDPRNAELLSRIDATRCATCHTEHRPEMTRVMGVTQPDDHCVHCHSQIAEERPSHRDLPFTSCASAGCHNFHDNRALYEDFLLRHSGQPALLPKPLLMARDFKTLAAMLPDYPSDRFPVQPLTRPQADAPQAALAHTTSVDAWLASSHAAAGVNCSGCHNDETTGAWIERPTHAVCTQCHAQEVAGFLGGKHGMRLAHGLSPMNPAQARLPMRKAAKDRELTCTTCHGAHEFDTRQAAVTACLGCHADEHSLAFQGSKHAQTWEAQNAGRGAPDSGVSCATCHLPRVESRDPDLDIRRTLVEHNQNETLRPNEKMARPVCLTCHGLQFTLDALADRALIARNFTGTPQPSVRSIEMAKARTKVRAAKKDARTTIVEPGHTDVPHRVSGGEQRKSHLSQSRGRVVTGVPSRP